MKGALAQSVPPVATTARDQSATTAAARRVTAVNTATEGVVPILEPHNYLNYLNPALYEQIMETLTEPAGFSEEDKKTKSLICGQEFATDLLYIGMFHAAQSGVSLANCSIRGNLP